MERTKELWAQENYPPTENEIKDPLLQESIQVQWILDLKEKLT